MLTPEQARDLVEHFGSQGAAARATGIPRPTIQHWLDPERHRAQMRRAYHAESGLARARRQLRMRRTKALLRRAEREKRRAA